MLSEEVAVVMEGRMRDHHGHVGGRLRAHELSESESIRSEGGTFEFSSGEDNEELECAGVAFFRKTIESNAIAIPQYPSAPELVYVARGSLILHVS